MIYSPSGASAGVGFAIPSDTVRRVVNQLVRHGRVIRPSLGLFIFVSCRFSHITYMMRPVFPCEYALVAQPSSVLLLPEMH